MRLRRIALLIGGAVALAVMGSGLLAIATGADPWRYMVGVLAFAFIAGACGLLGAVLTVVAG